MTVWWLAWWYDDKVVSKEIGFSQNLSMLSSPDAACPSLPGASRISDILCCLRIGAWTLGCTPSIEKLRCLTRGGRGRDDCGRDDVGVAAAAASVVGVVKLSDVTELRCLRIVFRTDKEATVCITKSLHQNHTSHLYTFNIIMCTTPFVSVYCTWSQVIESV